MAWLLTKYAASGRKGYVSKKFDYFDENVCPIICLFRKKYKSINEIEAAISLV